MPAHRPKGARRHLSSPKKKNLFFKKALTFAWRERKKISLTAGALGTFLGAMLLWQHGILPRLNRFCATSLRIKEVVIHGNQRTSRRALEQILSPLQEVPLPYADLEGLKESLQRLPWVRTAALFRSYPTRALSVKLIERKPMALWQDRGSFRLVDEDGEIIPCAKKDFPADLKIIVGQGAPQKAREILTLLWEYPRIAQAVSALTLMRSGRWDLHFKGGLLVKMPFGQDAMRQALAQLLRFRREGATVNVSCLDMRVEGVVSVRFHPVKTPTGSGG